MNIVRLFERADFHKVARAFGLNPAALDDKDQDLQPSKATVEAAWRRITNEADQIERLFISIYYKLSTLKEWERSGFVIPDDVDQGQEWWQLRIKALPILLGRMGYLDDQFQDGLGI